MSQYNEKSKAYTMQYMKDKLDEIKFRVPKGKKDEYRRAAESLGMKLTPFIVAAIEEKIDRDLGESTNTCME
ncbi:MAG: antitoxin [Lachnospiraceae bacterium]|nr:antitoxin [Lachnospiraceae bacterium]